MSGLNKLYFGWSAYFKEPWKNPQLPESIKTLYENDILHLLSGHIEHQKVMLILEAPEDNSPQWITGRLKGRLHHFLRNNTPDFPGFDRSFLLQSLSQNTKEIVSRYIQSQVDRSTLVDPLYRKRMNDEN